MNIKVIKNVGKARVEFSTSGQIDDAMLELDAFMKHDQCVCGSEDIEFDTTKAQGQYMYIKRKCLKCSKESTLGRKKDGGGFWWKEWVEYVPNSPQPNDAPAQGQQTKVNVEDIGF